MKQKTRSFILRAAVSSAALTSVAMAGMAAQGALRVYYANDPVGRNVVMIVSRAPLETMLTRTGDVKAHISIDESNVLDVPRARFEVDMASLETGIKMRDEHMRSDKWLDVAKYPKAIFTLTKVLRPTGAIALQNGKIMDGEVEGIMQMHGVMKTVRALITIRTLAADENTGARLKGDLIHIRATFPLKLKDFNIAVPASAQLKVAAEQEVTLDAFASTQSEKPVLSGSAPAANANATNTNTANTNAANTNTANTQRNQMTLPGGLIVEDTQVGDGREAKTGDRVRVHYRGTLQNGNEFDSSFSRNQPFAFRLGEGGVIEGWEKGVVGLKVGGKRKLTIPPAMGYGARGMPPVIPGNATLNFDIELVGID